MKTLLIVESDKRDRQALSAVIHRSGISIDTILECNNANDAMYILQNQKIDVIFTNINMEDMDGIAFVQNARVLDELMKMVVVSESDEFVYAVQLLRLGVRDYLLKPIQKRQVVRCLEMFETELALSIEDRITTSTIKGQQLKQLLLKGDTSASELDSIMRQCDSVLFDNAYVVCCLDDMGGDSYIRESRGYLGHVEQSEIYILEATLLEKVRLQEWRRRYVGVSNIHIGIEQLQEAYKEALEARVEAFYREKYIVMYDDFKVDTNVLVKEGALEAPEILNMIHILGTAKAAQVEKLIKAFLWVNKRAKNMPDLQRAVSSFFDNLEVHYPVVAKEENETIQSLKSPLSYPSIDTYEHMLLHWIEVLIEKVQLQLNTYKNKEKMQKAIAYIQANYNQDFNMAVVSNEVSMNYTLFSIEFKEYTGTNFVNYLKGIRMEKAKEYLQGSEMRISEISQRVGYENEKHFMKIFKSMYGVSPTEYRKSVQLKK